MVIISLLMTFFLTFIITGFMLYVAMVTGIGPWIGPIIGILLQGASRVIPSFFNNNKGLVITTSSSVGGIIGTAFGFSFPTWFFLEKEVFTMYVHNHVLLFLLMIMSLVVVAGIIGKVCSDLFYQELIEEKNLSFPVGTMTYKSVTHHNAQEKHYLFAGIISYIAYSVIFIKRLWGRYALPLRYNFYNGYSSSFFAIPEVVIDFSIIPLLVAIGFVAGNIMAFPLAIGALVKMTALTWLYNWYSFLPYNDFLFAFCSGIVLAGTLGGLLQQSFNVIKSSYTLFFERAVNTVRWKKEYSGIFILGLLFIGYGYCYHFSLAGSLYLFVATFLCAYQISFIAGKIGLALLGRFATFVMVPGLLLFSWNPLQVTLVATFVELVGGIAVDNLHGRKAFQLAHVNSSDYKKYHYIALISAACATALFFYYFVTYYHLGSSLLCAQRAQARALLLQVASVNLPVLGWGVLVGLLLKYFSCNPVLVLSGLLMPFSLLLPLVVGGIGAVVIKHSKNYEPFFSGVYVANACASILSMFL